MHDAVSFVQEQSQSNREQSVAEWETFTGQKFPDDPQAQTTIFDAAVARKQKAINTWQDNGIAITQRLAEQGIGLHEIEKHPDIVAWFEKEPDTTGFDKVGENRDNILKLQYINVKPIFTALEEESKNRLEGLTGHESPAELRARFGDKGPDVLDPRLQLLKDAGLPWIQDDTPYEDQIDPEEGRGVHTSNTNRYNPYQGTGSFSSGHFGGDDDDENLTNAEAQAIADGAVPHR